MLSQFCVMYLECEGIAFRTAHTLALILKMLKVFVYTNHSSVFMPSLFLRQDFMKLWLTWKSEIYLHLSCARIICMYHNLTIMRSAQYNVMLSKQTTSWIVQGIRKFLHTFNSYQNPVLSPYRWPVVQFRTDQQALNYPVFYNNESIY